jgi:hypothetical protein
MKIRGFIHCCQTGNWKRSFTMLYKELISSSLYDMAEHITICVVADTTPDLNFINMPKIEIKHVGSNRDYERPALLAMQKDAIDSQEEIYYWYIHTKGLRWFGTPKEQNVVDWINLLLYWNIEQWKQAIVYLNKGYDIYGCNQTDIPVPHYSGNFWWARSSYLKKLPTNIGPSYNDPEFWLFLSNPKYYCIFRSGLEGMGHYDNRFQTYRYIL